MRRKPKKLVRERRLRGDRPAASARWCTRIIPPARSLTYLPSKCIVTLRTYTSRVHSYSYARNVRVRNSNNSSIACPTRPRWEAAVRRQDTCPALPRWSFSRPVSRGVHRHRHLSLSLLRPTLKLVEDARVTRIVAMVIVFYAGADLRTCKCGISLLYHPSFIINALVSISCATHVADQRSSSQSFRGTDRSGDLNNICLLCVDIQDILIIHIQKTIMLLTYITNVQAQLLSVAFHLKYYLKKE